MQYTRYLPKIFGNKTKINILRVFYRLPDKTWTSRELARYIGTYNTTILDNLNDFIDFGLLDIGAHGHSKTIKVNKKSYVFTQIICPLFETEQNTFSALLSELKMMIKPNEVTLFALFGSVAEHMEKPNSDIDLLIVTDNKERVETILTKKQGIIAAQFGNELSHHIFSLEEFKKKQKSPFLQDAKKKSLIFYGEWK